MVAAGILLSRIVGLIRNRVFAHYFGTSDAADAFNAAFRIPNFLQNLFGEGVLSASFIPVYAGLSARGEEAEARRAPRASWRRCSGWRSRVLVLVGVLLTPWLIDLIAPGFEGEKRDATIRLVRILFPGAGLLVLSAWCLGILNSHRRFFLSYAAPVLWNLTIIATPDRGSGDALSGYPLAEIAAWGSVAGSLLQFGDPAPGGPPAARRHRSDHAARQRAAVRDGAPQLRPGVRRPRRGPDQRLRRHACSPVSCRPAPSRASPTRRCCTRCR